MENLKLKIELIPKSAWGNNLRGLLAKKDWDQIRVACYIRSKNTCVICGWTEENLDTHEVWDFDMESQTQRLRDVVSLCSACHGVKHMKNSERIGYGDNCKKHFMRVNECDEKTYTEHYVAGQILYDERGKVEKWKLDVSELRSLGGKGLEIVTIKNPYEDKCWLGEYGVKVKNRTIKVKAIGIKKIEWVDGDEIIKSVETNLCVGISRFVVNKNHTSIRFKLVRKNNAIMSKTFVIQREVI